MFTSSVLGPVWFELFGSVLEFRVCSACLFFVDLKKYLSSYAGSVLCFHGVVVFCTMFFIG
jgi:hypothetical protein